MYMVLWLWDVANRNQTAKSPPPTLFFKTFESQYFRFEKALIMQDSFLRIQDI